MDAKESLIVVELIKSIITRVNSKKKIRCKIMILFKHIIIVISYLNSPQTIINLSCSLHFLFPFFAFKSIRFEIKRKATTLDRHIVVYYMYFRL